MASHSESSRNRLAGELEIGCPADVDDDLLPSKPAKIARKQRSLKIGMGRSWIRLPESKTLFRKSEMKTAFTIMSIISLGLVALLSADQNAELAAPVESVVEPSEGQSTGRRDQRQRHPRWSAEGKSL